MGLTGGLVRSVFSKSRSIGTQESNVRNNNMVVDKRRWSSVRSYLCGDEFNSVLAEEGSGSVRSSEATTVSQPILLDEDFITYKLETESEVTLEEENQNSSTYLCYEHDAAAIIIQSAFRGYMVRRRREVIESMSNEKENDVERKSPSRESSVGTSLEVQTGNSISVFTTPEENAAFQHRMQQKARSQALKLKEDWDDSTVSSNISKMRIQNRLEATTRRERALAYAFSQQLRICSKKRQTKSDDTTEKQPNMGWSWLERWMATRLPENSSTSVEDRISKQLEPVTGNQRWAFGNKLLDISMEGKESCGSNEVPVQIDISFPNPALEEVSLSSSNKPVKNRLKATRRSVSRRKTVPSYHCPNEYKMVCKKDIEINDHENGNKMHAARKASFVSKKEIKDDASSQLEQDDS